MVVVTLVSERGLGCPARLLGGRMSHLGLDQLSEDLRFSAEAPRRGWTGLPLWFRDVTWTLTHPRSVPVLAMATYNETKGPQH